MNIYAYAVLIEIKHFVCDYYLQTFYMWEGKRASTGWLLPLLLHSFVNASGSFIVVYALSGNLEFARLAFALDLIFHSVIDRSKLLVERFTPPAPMWTRVPTFIDQAAHQLTYFTIFYLFN